MRRSIPVLAFVALLHARGGGAQDIAVLPLGGDQQKIKVVERFDKNGDKRLDASERRAARDALRGVASSPALRISASVVTPGEHLTPADVKAVTSNVPVFDQATLRTIFLQF